MFGELIKALVLVAALLGVFAYADGSVSVQPPPAPKVLEEAEMYPHYLGVIGQCMVRAFVIREGETHPDREFLLALARGIYAKVADRHGGEWPRNREKLVTIEWHDEENQDYYVVIEFLLLEQV